VRKTLAGVSIVLAVLVVYARTVGYGLFSDDFNWLVDAQVFDAGGLFDLSNRTHFFRPVVQVYFPLALGVCGRSAECYHWLNIALHAGTSLLVGTLAGLISKTRAVGVLAGVLFAVMPGPAEAVAWVACVPEILAAAWFVLTVWLFRRAIVSKQRWLYAAATMLTFVLCLLTHESGVTLLPVMALSIWLLPPDDAVRYDVGKTVRMFVPLALVLTAYLLVEYIINSRNYLVVEGQYGLGPHMLSNALGALATLAVTRHGTVWLIGFGAVALWAVLAAPPRIRFYALFTFITLAPVVGFRGGLASRYFVPAGGGLRGHDGGSPLVGAWFAQPMAAGRYRYLVGGDDRVDSALRELRGKKTRACGGEQSVPFSAYAARVRQLYPAPAPRRDIGSSDASRRSLAAVFASATAVGIRGRDAEAHRARPLAWIYSARSHG
jgi:hypothetical protein